MPPPPSYADLSPAACFGKMPTHGDFVRFNASGAAIRAFDDWLRQGMYHASRAPGRPLEAVYDEAPPLRFVFASDAAAEALLGVLKLSRDRSGRQYPIFVAVQTSARALRARAFPEIAARFATFFDDASAFVVEAASGRIGHYDLVERLRAFDAAIAEDRDAPDTLSRYLADTSFGAFADCVWDTFEDTRKYLLFKNLLDAAHANEQAAPLPALRKGLRLPLCTDGVPPGCDLGFWMQAIVRLAGAAARDTRPTYFWNAPSERFPAKLLFHLDSPVETTLADALPLGQSGESVLELEAIGREHAAQAALSIPARYGTLLEADRSSLMHLLRSL